MSGEIAGVSLPLKCDNDYHYRRGMNRECWLEVDTLGCRKGKMPLTHTERPAQKNHRRLHSQPKQGADKRAKTDMGDYLHNVKQAPHEHLTVGDVA